MFYTLFRRRNVIKAAAAGSQEGTVELVQRGDWKAIDAALRSTERDSLSYYLHQIYFKLGDEKRKTLRARLSGHLDDPWAAAKLCHFFPVVAAMASGSIQAKIAAAVRCSLEVYRRVQASCYDEFGKLVAKPKSPTLETAMQTVRIGMQVLRHHRHADLPKLNKEVAETIERCRELSVEVGLTNWREPYSEDMGWIKGEKA